MFLTTLEVLNQALHTKSYSVKPPLVMNDIGKIIGEGPWFAEGEEYEVQRKLLLPAFSHARIILRGRYPGFGLRGWK